MAPTKDTLQLSKNPVLAKAQTLCANQEYLAFLELFNEVEDRLCGEDLGELYLMRAQIKLNIADETVADDLRMAKKLLPGGNRLPTLATRYRTDSPNLFTVLNPEGGSLSRYKLSMRKSLQMLQAICGENIEIPYLTEAEIHYFIGYIEKAMDIAEPIYQDAAQNNRHYAAIIAGFILVRCYVALGEAEKLDNVMTQLFRYSKILSRPTYREMYNAIKGWVNCTTGWMGETPRYNVAPNGVKAIVLDDRIQVVEEGIALRTRFEDAVLHAARYANPEAYSMKDLYLNIYEAMLLFKVGKRNQAVSLFYQMYLLTQKNRIIMPFVEYGAQILPLLQYAMSRKDSGRFARRWSDKLNQMATQYEAGLLVVRGENHEDRAITEALTKEETDILRMLTEDLTITEVSEAMELAVERTKEHIRSIYRKMGVHNRAEAAAKARGGRILQTDE